MFLLDGQQIDLCPDRELATCIMVFFPGNKLCWNICTQRRRWTQWSCAMQFDCMVILLAHIHMGGHIWRRFCSGLKVYEERNKITDELIPATTGATIWRNNFHSDKWRGTISERWKTTEGDYSKEKNNSILISYSTERIHHFNNSIVIKLLNYTMINESFNLH